MPIPRWYERLLETTRGKVLSLLRSEPRTVSEMADRLELSGNAIRRHLTALERDRLVETAGTRRDGVGKPARLYRLTDEARDFFPRAHALVLVQLLTTLRDRTCPEEVDAVLREAGRALGARSRRAGFPSSAPLEERVRKAAELLRELGGVPRVERSNGDFRIRGSSCPLAGVVEEHPSACALAEALLEEILGTSVSERCRRDGGRPGCVFEIAGGTNGDR